MEHTTDGKRFKTALLACAEVYGKTLSDPVATIWWNALKDHDIEAVEGAFTKHLQSPDAGQFMPKPADVIRMLVGTSLDTAMVAWSKVDRGVRSVGPYASVTFDDALIQRVVQDMGGWVFLNDVKTDKDWVFVGNEFRTRYQAYRSRQEAPDYPRVLVGIAEAANAQRGHDAPTSVLIGDSAKAALVAKGGSDKSATLIHRLAGPKTLLLGDDPEKAH